LGGTTVAVGNGRGLMYEEVEELVAPIEAEVITNPGGAVRFAESSFPELALFVSDAVETCVDPDGTVTGAMLTSTFLGTTVPCALAPPAVAANARSASVSAAISAVARHTPRVAVVPVAARADFQWLLVTDSSCPRFPIRAI
jgi:hypothetical protein